MTGKTTPEIHNESAWDEMLLITGAIIRPGAVLTPDMAGSRLLVQARSYTFNAARKRLDISKASLDKAVEAGLLHTFVDPENQMRLPADMVESVFTDPVLYEQVVAHEKVEPREIAEVLDLSYSAVRRRLEKAGINRNNPRWGEVRGQWGLPETLRGFYEALADRQRQKRDEKKAKQTDKREKERQKREDERRRREELREKLIEAFPAWENEDRVNQTLLLHVGPPNSGKTHDALSRLVEAGRGWYLAPLRLLAFEIFDRLNQRGVFCNLLTGEEYIDIPGASITAATIEMFNPLHSGDCVIIDEAQMLTDPDRGWAWTRAMMQAQSPEIHVIGPPQIQQLVERMTAAADIPLGVVQHHRLAPIKVSERPWMLEKLPPRTILVAFSRRMVLELKTKLERFKRTVSVVYGTLPPEVRRKQADRFAAGETEICIATDAVGMGLNLPADYVCFYEVEKFDGRNSRRLTPGEVQQIGGRAGRFGYSQAGEIGATNRHNLETIRELYYTETPDLTFARVAPVVDELEMIPGSLAERLQEWASLESIPAALRSVVKTADLSERIELAAMLTDAEVDQLGLERAVRLINAPTRKSSRDFWYACTRSILAAEPMPVPPQPPRKIDDSEELDFTETCIACADIYLWLSQRQEFMAHAPEAIDIRSRRVEWSMQIDEALLRKINMARRCRECRKELPPGHPYTICDRCYASRYLDLEF
ncbi:MAG: hypothetical protein MUE40_01665 [Anaerolineae bacterium]|jgi:ATP-dependent RNA helicase SUPV3L1/SUV3|nr:hypothetical protein [Anaerolineae bacterium]